MKTGGSPSSLNQKKCREANISHFILHFTFADTVRIHYLINILTLVYE